MQTVVNVTVIKLKFYIHTHYGDSVCSKNGSLQCSFSNVI